MRQFGDDFAVIATGMGARELCQDSAMRPIRGQLVLLEPQDLGYLFSHAGGLFNQIESLLGYTYIALTKNATLALPATSSPSPTG